MSDTELRDVKLEGAYNFRDIGGDATDDGRTVRRGLVFRSAALSSLTSDDLVRLGAIGISLVVDLRTNAERARRPGLMPVETWARDYEASDGDLIVALTDPKITAQRCRDLMCITYDKMPDEQANSYAELFRRIADGHLPLVFHCAVGKDRTGVAAALLLTLLGVSRADIEVDYLSTRSVTERLVSDARAALAQMGSPPINDAVLLPIMGVEPNYLDAMFSGIDARYGSVSAYAEQRLGLSLDDVITIREKMLGPDRQKEGANRAPSP